MLIILMHYSLKYYFCQMKLLCYVLSFYIFSLVAIPCHDDANILLTQNIEKSTTHNQDKQNCDTCSPFCICNCCQTNTIVALYSIITANETVPSIFISFYNEAPIKDISLSIWQPPKIRC
jgi:hypothetical protein